MTPEQIEQATPLLAELRRLKSNYKDLTRTDYLEVTTGAVEIVLRKDNPFFEDVIATLIEHVTSEVDATQRALATLGVELKPEVVPA